MITDYTKTKLDEIRILEEIEAYLNFYMDDNKVNYDLLIHKEIENRLKDVVKEMFGDSPEGYRDTKGGNANDR